MLGPKSASMDRDREEIHSSPSPVQTSFQPDAVQILALGFDYKNYRLSIASDNLNSLEDDLSL